MTEDICRVTIVCDFSSQLFVRLDDPATVSMVLLWHWCNLIDQATEGMRRPFPIGPEQATQHIGRCYCYVVSNFLENDTYSCANEKWQHPQKHAIARCNDHTPLRRPEGWEG